MTKNEDNKKGWCCTVAQRGWVKPGTVGSSGQSSLCKTSFSACIHVDLTFHISPVHVSSSPAFKHEWLKADNKTVGSGGVFLVYT